MSLVLLFFFFKQKTAYEMRISDWSSDVCSSDLNKVGKSNFIRALQLILDPGLSERDRQLGLEHFWDGLGEDKLGETVEIAVELTDFTDDPRLMAHLNDCVVDPGPPMVARLTYRFQPKANLDRDPESLVDYEYIIFGGDDPEMSIGPSLRRMLPLDVQDRKSTRLNSSH